MEQHVRLTVAGGTSVSESSSWADAKRIFSEALDLPREQREAFVASACGAGSELLGEVQSLLAWHDQSTGFLEEPAARLQSFGLTPTTSSEPRRHDDRRLARGLARGRGRNGRGVPRRTGRCRVPAAGGAEGDPPGVGFGRHRAPVSSRARDAGRAGSSEHRAAAGRRHDPRRTAVLRDGVRRGRADRPLLRRAAPARREAAPALSIGVRRRAVRPREPGGAPRHQAGQHPGDARRHAEAAGLRRRQARRRAAPPSWTRPRRPPPG